MVKRLLLAIPFLLLAPLWAGAFDFAPYQDLLNSYLVADQQVRGIPVNLVDYRRWKAEQDRPGTPYRKLLKDLAAFDPATLKGKEARMAFWINVYNIAAIKTILDHYPVESIRSSKIHWLKNPWKKQGVVVGGRFRSLHAIEFDLLVQGERDLRAHLAINCASVSCADLRPEPFLPERLDEQLRQQGERLAAQRSKGLRIDPEAKLVYVSQIFKFDRERFEVWAGGPIPFLLPYVKDAEVRAFLRRGDFRLLYLDYDWAVNDLTQGP